MIWDSLLTRRDADRETTRVGGEKKEERRGRVLLVREEGRKKGRIEVEVEGSKYLDIGTLKRQVPVTAYPLML